MSTTLGRVSRILLVVFAFVLGAGSMLFVVIASDEGRPAGLFGSASTDSAYHVIDVQQPVAVISPVVDKMSEPSLMTEVRAESETGYELADADPATDYASAASEQFDSEPAWSPDPFSAPAPDLAQAAGDSAVLPATDPPLADDSTFSNPAAVGSSVDLVPGAEPSADPFAPEAIGPHDLIPHNAPITLPGPPFVGNVPQASGPPAVQKGLVIIRLVGNEDGSLKELRYLTDDLGNDDAAFETLKQRVEEFSKEFDAAVAQQTEVQIVADPALRYEHVARVVAVCESFVDRVSFARAESEHRLEIAVGFVRDATGEKVIDQPVAFIGDKLVRTGELFDVLTAWRAENDQQLGDGVTIVIRADADVDYKVIEGLVREAQRAGFERFSLKSLDRGVGVVKNVQSSTDGALVEITLGLDDGIRVGDWLEAYQPNEGGGSPKDEYITKLEVVSVERDSSVCRIISASFDGPHLGERVVFAHRPN